MGDPPRKTEIAMQRKTVAKSPLLTYENLVVLGLP